MFVHAHSCYSLRYGVLQPEGVLDLTAEMGYDTLVLADINNTSAGLDTIRLAQKRGQRVVLGIDFRNGISSCYIGVAITNAGYEELNRHLSEHSHAGLAFPEKAPRFKHALIIYPWEKLKAAKNQTGWLASLHEREFVSVLPHQVPGLRLLRKKIALDKLVAWNTSSFRNKRDFNAHRLLRSVDNNCLLSMLPEDEQSSLHFSWQEKGDWLALYQDFPELVDRGEELINSCSVHFDFGSSIAPQNQRSYTSNEELDFRLVRRLAYRGLSYRYPSLTKQISERLEKELYIIKEKNFVSYFLINWKILKYARSKGYFYVGRGSGANSIVAYLLRITDVDPIDLDLYFERFINLYRQNPPDFDIDFSWRDRDDITRFIFERFQHTALLATYNTFQYRAVVRELGKVFGLPKHEIDVLSRSDSAPKDTHSGLVLKYARMLHGLPNYLSIHSAGILIANRPIEWFSGTFLPPKGYPTTHFDMHIAEDVGLYKFDILSQRGLGKIRETIDIIRYNQPTNPLQVNIHNMAEFKEDKRIIAMLKEARAIGCFYVESPAMRMLLKKLRCDGYLTLVAASSVIRPGVSNSGMMRQYILRFRQPERRLDAHPTLLEIMPDTFGVMVYQEDVIKVAHYFAGLTLGEADVLRRGMSGKFRSREEFDKAKQAFFDKGVAKGNSMEVVAEVWRQVSSFAGYAFAKGHSASYAVESFQSLYLKAYYPLEYMVATINNGGGFYSREFYIHEARMLGATVHAPCINHSWGRCRIIDKDIYLALCMINGLENKWAQQIVEARQLDGPFTTLEEFIYRCAVNSREQLVLLIRAGALRCINPNKKELMWKVYQLIGSASRSSTPDLFLPEVQEAHLPALNYDVIEDAFDELELFGFPLCHPFLLLKDAPHGHVMAKDIPLHKGKPVVLYGYLVTIKPTKTAKGDRMHFGTFIDEAGEFIDTVHFPPSSAAFPFRGKGVYRIEGRVMEEFDCYTVEVSAMYRMDYRQDPRYDDLRTATREREKRKKIASNSSHHR